jgi:phage portal protein BeeE
VYTIETAEDLTPDEAQDLMNQWAISRQQNFGVPPVLDNGATPKPHQGMSPKDMAMIEIAQFTEARIAVMLGTPPFIVGLSGPDSMTYSNVSQVFDQHDRMSLRPMAAHVMGALSGWALPSTQRCELNRDEYSRPAFNERVAAWAVMIEKKMASVEEFRAAERLQGEKPEPVTDQLLSAADPEGDVQLRRLA